MVFRAATFTCILVSAFRDIILEVIILKEICHDTAPFL